MKLNASIGSAENGGAASLSTEYLQPSARQTQYYDFAKDHRKPAYATPLTLEEQRPQPLLLDEGGYVASGGPPPSPAQLSATRAAGGGGSGSSSIA